MLSNISFMLSGAALVAVGVLISAVADRIRGARLMREVAPSKRAAAAAPKSAERQIEVVEVEQPARPRAKAKAPAVHDNAMDVVEALRAAGYKREVAIEAVGNCTVAERATIEAWTAAALRRAAKGAVS